MQSDLKGKVVLVTGAGGGIGSAIAKAFLKEGAKTVLHYRKSAQNVAATRKAFPPAQSMAIAADLTSEARTVKLFQSVIKRFGCIDVLIANAASWETADVPLHQMSLKQWRTTIEGVLTSTFLTAREFLKGVQQRKRGNIVLISSTAAIFGEAGHADYAAAKAAIAYGLTRSLKNEISKVAPHTRDYCGGRVNCICPGWTVVPRLAKKLGDPAAIRKVAATMALPQLGRPEDVANAAVFLASDKLARHITGQTITIAGGMEGRLLREGKEVDTTIV